MQKNVWPLVSCLCLGCFGRRFALVSELIIESTRPSSNKPTEDGDGGGEERDLAALSRVIFIWTKRMLDQRRSSTIALDAARASPE